MKHVYPRPNGRRLVWNFNRISTRTRTLTSQIKRKLRQRTWSFNKKNQQARATYHLRPNLFVEERNRVSFYHVPRWSQGYFLHFTRNLGICCKKFWLNWFLIFCCRVKCTLGTVSVGHCQFCLRVCMDQASSRLGGSLLAAWFNKLILLRSSLNDNDLKTATRPDMAKEKLMTFSELCILSGGKVLSLSRCAPTTVCGCQNFRARWPVPSLHITKI